MSALPFETQKYIDLAEQSSKVLPPDKLVWYYLIVAAIFMLKYIRDEIRNLDDE